MQPLYTNGSLICKASSMRKAIPVILLNVLSLFPFFLAGQNTAIVMDKTHSLSLQAQFSQYKDQFNYGLVYRGVNLGGNYSCIRTLGKKVLSYNAGVIFGLNTNKGTGVALRIKPVDFFTDIKYPLHHSLLADLSLIIINGSYIPIYRAAICSGLPQWKSVPGLLLML